MQKVLLMGPHNGGKTSMRSVIFANFLARDTGRLGATVEMMRSQIKVLGSFVLNMWDCGGQTNYIRGYLDKQRQQTFSHVAALIYVCDAPVLSRAAEEGTQAEALSDFKETLQALREHSPRARVFVLVHKVDLLSAGEDKVAALIADIKAHLFPTVAATATTGAGATTVGTDAGDTYNSHSHTLDQDGDGDGPLERVNTLGSDGGANEFGSANDVLSPIGASSQPTGQSHQSARSEGGGEGLNIANSGGDTASAASTALPLVATSPPQFFCTTIWDDSLFKAWGSMLRCLIPHLNLLERYLATSLDAMGLTEATVLDLSTLLTVCNVVAEGREAQEASRVTSALKAFKLSCTKSHRAFTDFVMVSGRATIVFDRLTANTMAMLVALDASPEVMRLQAAGLRQGLAPYLEAQGPDGITLRNVL